MRKGTFVPARTFFFDEIHFLMSNCKEPRKYMWNTKYIQVTTVNDHHHLLKNFPDASIRRCKLKFNIT